MSKIFDAARIFVAGIFLFGILIGGNAKAAELDAMQIFRETVMETAKKDDRVFHQDIFFVVPSAVSELDFFASTAGDKLNVAGEFGFWLTAPDGSPVENEVPFYIAQGADNVTLYFQTDKKWKKMTTPLKASQLTDIFNVNAQAVEEQIALVKEVQILRETDSQRMFLVKIDGKKLAEKIKAVLDTNAENPTDPQISAIKNQIVGYIDTGFQNADIWYTWSVDKMNWRTVTVSANLSNLIQSVAQAVLNDTSAPIPAPFNEMLETLAYFSEFKAYTTYLNDEARSRLEIPKKVLKAKEVESFTDTGSKKKK